MAPSPLLIIEDLFARSGGGASLYKLCAKKNLTYCDAAYKTVENKEGTLAEVHSVLSDCGQRR